MGTAESFFVLFMLCFGVYLCDCAKINTPRVLLPWFENTKVNFTFEIHEGGCYTWSLSRDDIIDLEPLYQDTWGHCSRAARVSVSKSCSPPGSVIILAEEVNTGEILRGDVDIDQIKLLEVMSTTWKLYLEEAPEAFEVVAYDEQGNKFSTLEGLSLTWNIENEGNKAEDELLVTFVRWRDTDYEAPPGVAELEAQGLRSHSVLLYGQAMGNCRVTACLGDICTDFKLQVVASVVLTPATALIAPGDTLKYKVVRARAGRLTIQDISDTLYFIKLPQTDVAELADSISLVRGTDTGTTNVLLYSGSTEVATATLTVTEPHSIRVTLRPPNLLIRGENFVIHSVVLDKSGHPLMSGDQILIRLSVDGEANVDLLRSTENGTVTDAVAHNSGPFIVTARLHSIAGKLITRKVEGQVTAFVVDPLEVVPPELFVAWTENVRDIPLEHHGGGDEAVVWSEVDVDGPLSVSSSGVVSVKGEGYVAVKVQLAKYPHVHATGRVWSAVPEMIQVSTIGYARVGRPHHLHVALTAAHPTTGELYNFHSCDCASFAVSLLEGPEPHNVTAATWIEPADGACCVLETIFIARGISSVRVSRGRAGDTARVAVRAAPSLLWPDNAAALVGASLPVLAEGEALLAQSSDPRIVELSRRDGSPPHRYPEIQLFTLKCRRKGDSRLELASHSDDEPESVQFEAACAPYVSRARLEPPEPPGNCSGGPKLWLRPGLEVPIKVTLLDAIGRELLDERGPKVSWESEPSHVGIEYRSTDRLFIQTHPEYEPVPVPYKYYQVVIADEKAVGWSGTLKATIPETTASIQAIVVAPLRCEPLKMSLAWEGETLTNIASVTGGSGRYAVDSPKGVSAAVEKGSLTVTVPGPGSYDLTITDLCVLGEKQIVEVYIEEVLSVEVSTSRAVGVNACVPISALVKGISHRYLSIGREPEWRTNGDVIVKEGKLLCGVREGSGRVRASRAGVWSPEVEVLVFPPLEIIPGRAAVPPGARLQLRHHGGPPPHLASLHYKLSDQQNHIEVSSSGSVHGISMGTARVKLVALDIANLEMASAESTVEVIPISGLRVRSATQTLLVGHPSPVWVEAGPLTAAALAALHPPPRVSFSLRDPAAARLYTTHVDDKLERSVAEGLSVRVVPLKPGVIVIDVRVRNMGQVADTRSWDSTIEILGISDIRTSIEGSSSELAPGDRVVLAVGASVRLKALPRGSWKVFDEGAIELTPNGEVVALQPGYGVIVAQHKDERNNIYRETIIHVEVGVPQYCTAEASGDAGAIRVVPRSAYGRALLAPAAVPAAAPHHARSAKPQDSVYGTELTIEGLEAAGSFVTFHSTVSGVTVKDEVWVTATDSKSERILMSGGWGVCLEGVGWRAPTGISLVAGSRVSLALGTRDAHATHVLRHERHHYTRTLHQLPLNKIEFQTGEWPPTLVPLSMEASGLTGGPLLCSEEQRYALEGVQVDLPFICRTKQPHNAEPVLDIINGQVGCKIIPATQITESSEVDLCAEWGAFRTCTKVLLLPPIRVSQSKVSLLSPPAVFTVAGHPRALRMTKLTTSPGLKIDTEAMPGEILVTVTNEASTCGLGWVTVNSKLTGQEIRVEVERACDVTCGTLLGALFALIYPYLSTIVTVAAVAAAYMYIQQRLQQKKIRKPTEPVQSVLPPTNSSPNSSLNRSRTWSRSPYASAGPGVPVYGDTSDLPDSSFSPTSNRTRGFDSRFL